MASPRYLCSHIATVKLAGAAWPVLIEEIWAEGAVVESEDEIPAAEFAQLECGGPFFAGRIGKAEQNEFGWRSEISFDAQTPWSEKIFRPSHLLDPREVKGPEKG